MIQHLQKHLPNKASKKALYFKNLNKQYARRTPFSLLHFLKKKCTDPTKKIQTLKSLRGMLPFLSHHTALSIYNQASKIAPISPKISPNARNRATRVHPKRVALSLPGPLELGAPPARRTFRLPYSIFYNLIYPAEVLRSRYRKFTRTIVLLLIESLELKNSVMRPLFSLSNPLAHLLDIPWTSRWAEFTAVYGSFYELPQIQLYVRAHSNTKYPVRHLICFKFLGPKLALSLVDRPSHKTHFFVSPGLLLKHFNFKKSLKKNKSMKLLTMRFLRKLLLIIRFKNLTVHAKGVPLFLDTLINTLYRPVTHPMRNPLTGSLIDEVTSKPRNLLISGITFFHPKPYGSLKQKKKGRIKRKIRRKVIKSNRVIDEM